MYNINSEAKSLRKIIAAGAANEKMALPGPLRRSPHEESCYTPCNVPDVLLTQSHPPSVFSKKFYELLLPHVACAKCSRNRELLTSSHSIAP